MADTTPLLFVQGSTNGRGIMIYDQAGVGTERYTRIRARGIAYANLDHAHEAGQLNIQGHGRYMTLLGPSAPQAAEYVDRQINGKVIILVHNHRTSAFPTQNPVQGDPVVDAPHLRTRNDHITIQTHRDLRPETLMMLLMYAPMGNPLEPLSGSLESLRVLTDDLHDRLPHDADLRLAMQRYNISMDTYNDHVYDAVLTFPAEHPLTAREAWARVSSQRRDRLPQLRGHWQDLITIMRSRLNAIRREASTPQLAEVCRMLIPTLSSWKGGLELTCTVPGYNP